MVLIGLAALTIDFNFINLFSTLIFFSRKKKPFWYCKNNLFFPVLQITLFKENKRLKLTKIKKENYYFLYLQLIIIF